MLFAFTSTPASWKDPPSGKNDQYSCENSVSALSEEVARGYPIAVGVLECLITLKGSAMVYKTAIRAVPRVSQRA